MPSAMSNEIEVALLSSRTRATVPPRISRTTGSSASERAFQASQSPLRLAPDAVDYVLADRSGQHRVHRASHAAVVGPREISPGDQGRRRPGRGAGRRAANCFAILRVLPSLPVNRARGTAIRVLPNVPVMRPFSVMLAVHADNRRLSPRLSLRVYADYMRMRYRSLKVLPPASSR